ncbi:hypothetical protein HYH03_014318 [Edaphochlamys debaryana]|uniref:CBS domain-containing protein n=1 Tax=Edaphochlamys debaryana TaxID=47281 RepID=A0A835XPB8_9CHLO|nr:hypothetical protein HYH03_014318 [Edaphochlamys debaryana]|eukprot:KAG2487072.1 hypothetical protein HYH03_014318 [Edaphochlamys debaryana]
MSLAGSLVMPGTASPRTSLAARRQARRCAPQVIAQPLGLSGPSCSGRVEPQHAPAWSGLRVAQTLRAHRLATRVSAVDAVPGAAPVPASASLEKHQAHKNQPEVHNEVYGEMSCPMGGVEAVMRRANQGILTTTPDVTLAETIPLLNKVTGLPVLGEDGTVIGVISRKDIIRVRKSGGTMSEKVKKHMTSPALTVPLTASVKEAADLMLKFNIRRLPVVDSAGKPVGLVSRTDIFKPLGNYTKVMEEELAMLAGKGSWQIKYLYDESCPICRSMKDLLDRQDKGAGRIIFVDVSSSKYRPSKNMGISQDEAMTTIHAIRPDGSVLMGTDAIRSMYTVVGLGWLAFLMELPLFTAAVDALYDFISRNRISLGAAMDTLLAGKKLQMSKAGVTTCSDVDEECSVDW